MSVLETMGLTTYQSQTYLSLLESGPATAKQISQMSDVPMGRIYDVLDELEAYPLVEHQNTRPKRYVATQPEDAAQRVLDVRLAELQEQRDRYERIAANLPSRISSELGDEATIWNAAIGADDAGQLLVDRLNAATHSIELVIGPLSSVDARLQQAVAHIVPRLTDALSRGVSIRAVIQGELLDSILANFDEQLTEKLLTHPDCQIRESDNVDVTTYIIDTSELCLTIRTPLDNSQASTVINLRQPALADDFNAAFETIWADGSPTARAGEVSTTRQ